MYDLAIIGAGITGTAIARELAKYQLKIVLLEKNSDIASEATAANSGIIHDGYNAKTDKMKGRLMLRGNVLYDNLCRDLGVQMKRIGILIIALEENDRKTLEDLYAKGLANQVPGLRLLDQKELLAMEPGLNPKVIGALYSPSCGIVYPWEMAIALAENALDNGVQLFLNSQVIVLEKENNIFRLTVEDNRILKARCVINCGGIYADKINEMIASPSFKIIAKRGQYLVLDKNAGNLFQRIIFPCKKEEEKGVFMVPTIGGNLLLGPAMEPIEDPESNGVTEAGLAFIRKAVKKVSEQIPLQQTIQAFAGIKAKADTEDFLIEESREVKGFINVAGINSPGLTCAPAIAEYVSQIVENIYQRAGEVLRRKEYFNPHRKPPVRFRDLNEQQKAELVQGDPRYGRIICRCEMVTEGEIVSAIQRNCGATTLKGVKRRTGSGLGRCQGGFCGPRIVEILARELGKEMKEILYDHQNSYILKEQI